MSSPFDIKSAVRHPGLLSYLVGSTIGGLARPDNLEVLRQVVRMWADNDAIWTQLATHTAQQNQMVEDLARKEPKP